MKKLLSLVLMLTAAPPCAADNPGQDGAKDSYHYDPAVGWYWYNEPVPAEDSTQASPSPSPAPESPTQQMKRLQAWRDDLMNEAMLHPTTDNVRRYKIMQDWMVNQASLFASRWEKVLLENPDLDYGLKHPFYNGTAGISYAQQRKAQQDAIRFVNDRYGVFFFYRGTEPLDNRLGSVVKEFSAQYGLPVIPVSVDGRLNPDLPDSRYDRGQATHMHIAHFPAIFLVDPQTRKYQPLAYGFITQDDLARRMLNVVTDFRPED